MLRRFAVICVSCVSVALAAVDQAASENIVVDDKPGVNILTRMWRSADVQRVLMLLTIIGVGKILQSRFPDKEPTAVQKTLRLFFVPATFFQVVSKEKVDSSHTAYLVGGCGLVLLRSVSIFMVAYAVFGRSDASKVGTLRRTAIFEISTVASALTVIPFVAEFVSARYAGLGAMVDLPMKLHLGLVMPALLRKFGELPEDASGVDGCSRAKNILCRLGTDPITLSLVVGLAIATLTHGQGTGTLGFVGKAIDTIAGAQRAVYFIVIGLKMKFGGNEPFFSVVLLLGAQGVILVLLKMFLLAFQPSMDVAKYMIFFAQGAPSVVGIGAIAAATMSGVKGYSIDFAFDIVAMAFPISSLLQCTAGFLGDSYTYHLASVGALLVCVAALLRLAFDSLFVEIGATSWANGKLMRAFSQSPAGARDVEQAIAEAPSDKVAIELRNPLNTQ
eukprot:TRINITY_DN14393_c0_g7_i2.p1 TRINITY_DN14393_c0_g7~~TRINITY_DN14393_c0_g7_i2.p1  ORF type:complete len:446 (-),score=82.60 TRINITY_DN14393_c0_g7_i2:482-1819(-)